ncbi:GNAT family N-acetyltransferase [Luteitalea sp.]|jgi:GNAT superfamily N-acetyltransferase|uniref:GNAT family N-acetyltransferase n=1 Tax=Luteitalea sp. TaxID=2004800 RepID=UPI0037C99FF8
MLIRSATRDDVPALGRLGAQLMRQHHAFDARRFLAPGDAPEAGYGRFLGSQIDDPDVFLHVADVDGCVVGYVYAGIEPLSWKELRDECGFVHDLLVEESARGKGAGLALLEAAAAWFSSRAMPRVMLWTASQNATAQRLFARAGFRPTMIEMTREL